MTTPLYDETIRSTGTVPHPDTLDPEDLRSAQLRGLAMVVRASVVFMDFGVLEQTIVEEPYAQQPGWNFYHQYNFPTLEFWQGARENEPIQVPPLSRLDSPAPLPKRTRRGVIIENNPED